MAFFSAASHELKTPVTILKGQLTGMLDGVGVYRDRDKYLLRSLQVTGRMENLIQEMLSISRMETGSVPLIQESVGLSELIENQLSLDAQLLEQRGQKLVSTLTPGVNIIGDPSLLGKAVGNLLSNASLYSPEGAEVRVWCGYIEQRPALTVENTGAHIQDEALPHLFEAFYREDGFPQPQHRRQRPGAVYRAHDPPAPRRGMHNREHRRRRPRHGGVQPMS